MFCASFGGKFSVHLKVVFPIHTMFNQATIMEWIDSRPCLGSLRDHVVSVLVHDAGHDFMHCIRVAQWTCRLHPTGRVEACIASALLHDIVNVHKNDPQSKLSSESSAVQAEALLLPYVPNSFSLAEVAEISQAIRDHSFSRGAVPQTLLGKALQDADRLDALGVVGMFRNISCGTTMGARFFHPEDAWNVRRLRPWDDKVNSMDHYPLKLFTLERFMNTPGGREEARRRTDRMERILGEFGEEIGFPYDATCHRML